MSATDIGALRVADSAIEDARSDFGDPAAIEKIEGLLEADKLIEAVKLCRDNLHGDRNSLERASAIVNVIRLRCMQRAFDRRVTELLAANNAEVERRRLAGDREMAEPDMWWDNDEPERPWDDPEEWANHRGMLVGEVELVTFQTGYRGPDLEIVIEAYAPDPAADDVEYRVHRLATNAEAKAKRDEILKARDAAAQVAPADEAPDAQP